VRSRLATGGSTAVDAARSDRDSTYVPWLTEAGRGGGTQDFFKEMKGEERMVVHFYRKSNFPCKVRRGAPPTPLPSAALL
jgi:hypothetical protein